jgi:hypothetical protein
MKKVLLTLLMGTMSTLLAHAEIVYYISRSPSFSQTLEKIKAPVGMTNDGKYLGLTFLLAGMNQAINDVQVSMSNYIKACNDVDTYKQTTNPTNWYQPTFDALQHMSNLKLDDFHNSIDAYNLARNNNKALIDQTCQNLGLPQPTHGGTPGIKEMILGVGTVFMNR